MKTARKTRTLAILLFNDVELLDFCGPYEVFTAACRDTDPPAFDVFTVCERPERVLARNGLSIIPDHALSDSPQADILLVPGGMGTRAEIDNPPLIEWIRRTADGAELVLSVCTGALLLGKAGLLDGLEATTHHVSFELLREVAPGAVVREDCRFVDNGRVITSAGISAGIDMSLHVVERLLGADAAAATARHMEYSWSGESEVSSPTAGSNDVAQAYLDEARRQLAKATHLIKHCLGQLTEEQTWWRATDSQNSIANLVLHLCGNLRQWIVSGLGRAPDLRNRPQEFAERGSLSKLELLQRLERTVAAADRVLSTAASQRLLEDRTIQGFQTTGLSAIFDSVAHFKGHTQEIIGLTRMQLGDRYEFEWSPSTEEEGAE